ncbi:MAG: hypothetical protein RMK75_05495 [Aquificaceae bacterium]|nr:hypothetical protein [Aquificaceae bacterium]MDW8423761.1 hypothetical protein [Aquificaceae bacterium]
MLYKVLVTIFAILSVSFALTQEEEKQLLRDVAEIKATLKVFMEQVDKRFEQVDKRFEQVDKRFEQLERRIDDLVNFLWILSGIFVSITGVTIGFALWDRRTMVRPFEEKVKRIEEEFTRDREKVQGLLEALRNIAERDKEVANILKKMNLM